MSYKVSGDDRIRRVKYEYIVHYRVNRCKEYSCINIHAHTQYIPESKPTIRNSSPADHAREVPLSPTSTDISIAGPRVRTVDSPMIHEQFWYIIRYIE